MQILVELQFLSPQLEITLSTLKAVVLLVPWLREGRAYARQLTMASPSVQFLPQLLLLPPKVARPPELSQLPQMELRPVEVQLVLPFLPVTGYQLEMYSSTIMLVLTQQD
jgi:hypothetical protein